MAKHKKLDIFKDKKDKFFLSGGFKFARTQLEIQIANEVNS